MNTTLIKLKRWTSTTCLIAILTLLAEMAAAVPVIGYATTYTPFGGINGLWKIDLNSGDVQLVDNGLASTEKSGLASNSTGQLYSLSEGGALTSINKATGAESPIGDIGRFEFFGADFLGDTFVGAGSGGSGITRDDITFFTVDVTDASRTDFLTLSGIGTIGGMAIADPTTIFFTTGLFDTRELHVLDTATSTVSKIGNLSSVWWGLDFGPDGNLYGLGDSGIYRVDPFTAAETLIVDARPTILSGSFWQGLTIVAVPEPTTIALMGIGLVGVGLMRRRKASH